MTNISRIRAILGPTNTGKTHFAIERLLAYKTGMIGLPLRLLAREVYDSLCQKAGRGAVALITGEERIVPPRARYWVCTVEAMPQDQPVDCVAIDEIQMASHFERGHIFTQRLLHQRGIEETLLLGAQTIAPLLKQLLPKIDITIRPRLSKLNYAGSKKITRLPKRSAIVSFSTQEVYAIAELVRRQAGGAAIVMGALSPRTRNAQVALFESGEVNYLVATDAIGMGLNLDIHHVGLAATRKFDGHQIRELSPTELAQIAGRAGRHTKNGTFGVTGQIRELHQETVIQIETHEFASLQMLQWRERAQDFSSIPALLTNLKAPSQKKGLVRCPATPDLRALTYFSRQNDLLDMAYHRDKVKLAWDVCQIPDYRGIAPAQHTQFLSTVYTHLCQKGPLDNDFMQNQVCMAEKHGGEIDTLSQKLRDIRTASYLAHRKNWLKEPQFWQSRTKQIEEKLSDALHERLMQRFIDKRTAVLMKKLGERERVTATIDVTGQVRIENQDVGCLTGFRFSPAAASSDLDGKTLRQAAQQALSDEIDKRAKQVASAPNAEFTLGQDSHIRWKGEIIARLKAGGELYQPQLMILADESLSGARLSEVQDRLNLWLRNHINTLLAPLIALKNADDLDGLPRGLAFQLTENLGILPRHQVADDVKQIEQEQRAQLRKYGVRFGAYHIYLPALLKPAPRGLALILWGLFHEKMDEKGLLDIPQIMLAGRTSAAADEHISADAYLVGGFKQVGARTIRIDILERLADIIRPLIGFRDFSDPEKVPEGAEQGNRFSVTVEMTSLLGCAGDDFSDVLKALGYVVEKKLIEKPSDRPQIATAEQSVSAQAAQQVAQTTASAPEANQSEPEQEKPQATENAESAKQTADEPHYHEIWRPAYQNKRPLQNQKHFKSKAHKSASQKQKNNANTQPKKLNPDSPFAALAALKKGMGKS